MDTSADSATRPREVGITLALETHKGPTQNAVAMLALMDDVDHPQVRLNFDTGNIGYYNPGADPCDELERVKHLVRNVHVKDNRGGFEDWYFPAVGDGGSVDFVRVREILDGVGFLGPYTIEIEGIGGEAEPGLEARHGRRSSERGAPARLAGISLETSDLTGADGNRTHQGPVSRPLTGFEDQGRHQPAKRSLRGGNSTSYDYTRIPIRTPSTSL